MGEQTKGALKGALFGVAASILVAVLLGAIPAFSHWVRNDSDIASSKARLDKIEPTLTQILVDLAVFHADHMALQKEVRDGHAEEMTAIHELRKQAMENDNRARSRGAAARSDGQEPRPNRMIAGKNPGN